MTSVADAVHVSLASDLLLAILTPRAVDRIIRAVYGVYTLN